MPGRGLVQVVGEAGALHRRRRRTLLDALDKPDPKRACPRGRLRPEQVVGDQLRRVDVELRLNALRGEDRDRRQRTGRYGARGVHDRGSVPDHDRPHRHGECQGRKADDEPPVERPGDEAQYRQREADDGERPQQRDLGRVLGNRRRDHHPREQAERDRVDEPARRGARSRLRVGDHEEEEHEHLGRGDEHPPQVEARDRAEVPARGHRVAGEGEHADRHGEGGPEADRHPQQLQPPEDEESARDDDSEGGHEPR